MWLSLKSTASNTRVIIRLKRYSCVSCRAWIKKQVGFHLQVGFQKSISRGFARMNADQSKDQDNPTHLISSIFRSAFIRVNPRLDQVLARAFARARFWYFKRFALATRQPVIHRVKQIHQLDWRCQNVLGHALVLPGLTACKA